MDNGKVLHFLAVALAGWVNRYQRAIIDYLIEENRLRIVDCLCLKMIDGAWPPKQMSRYKTIIGRTMRSRTMPSRKTEAALALE
jgi:hypothetical protein